MELIYKKADANDIEDLVDLKIKQILFFYNRDGIVMKNENQKREDIKKILLQELNKTICFFIYKESAFRLLLNKKGLNRIESTSKRLKLKTLIF